MVGDAPDITSPGGVCGKFGNLHADFQCKGVRATKKV